MSEKDENNLDFLKKFNEIKYDISKASLEDIKDILNHYNQGPIMVDGYYTHYKISPIDAACLNARYNELTGEDHPVFMSEQEKVLDEVIKSGDGISVDGKPTIYQRLKNNLTGEGLGITILQNKKDSYIEKFNKIKYDMLEASLEDVKDILDHYDQDSVLIDGMQYHFRPNVLEGASLNARYHELTGQDHPTFAKMQDQLLDEQIKKEIGINVNGEPTIYEQLKNNTMEIGNKNHILNRTYDILNSPQEASLEDISSLLNYYNGKSVLINGIVKHPFNDPISAEKLNTRYHELTGQNHPVYEEQVPKVIEGLMKDKNILADAYGISYFGKLEKIMQDLEIPIPQINSEESKENYPIKKVDKSKFEQIFERTKGKLKGTVEKLKNRFKEDQTQDKNNDEMTK